jgi:probable HAF family extracellular repeat protein
MLNRNCLICLLALAQPAFAASITITSVGLPLGGDSTVVGINAAGQVAGTTLGGTGLSALGNVFFYSGGTTTNLGQLGGRTAGAAGLNNFGHIVGGVDIPGSGSTSFLYSNGSTKYLPAGFAAYSINDLGVIAGAIQFTGYYAAGLYSRGQVTNLGTPGPTFNLSQATAINDKGEVAGFAIDTANNVTAAFFYSNGVMTNIGSLSNLPYTTATAINRAGVVVGYSAPGNFSGPGTEAFVYYKGRIFALPTPSQVLGSQAFGINNRDQIVGSYTTGSPGVSSAFVYSNGLFIDLNRLLPAGSPWDLATAVGINDAGQIVGIGYLNGDFSQGANQVYLMDISGLK